MSMFSNIVDTVINEIRYHEYKAKQRSITRLFPTFFQRVDALRTKGGVKALSVRDPNTWMFEVASSSKKDPSKSYAVWFHFTDMEEKLQKWVPVKALWNTAKTDIDYRKLAAELLNDLDMQSDCDCEADTYWGSEYIKTQKNAQYGDQQNIAPNVRNPKKYGILCKHAELVWQQLLMYGSTMSKHLKEFWKKEIDAIVKATLEAEKKAEPEVKPEPIQKQKGKGEPMKTAEEKPLKRHGRLPEPEAKPEEPLKKRAGLPKPEEKKPETPLRRHQRLPEPEEDEEETA